MQEFVDELLNIVLVTLLDKIVANLELKHEYGHLTIKRCI